MYAHYKKQNTTRTEGGRVQIISRDGERFGRRGR